MQNQNVRKTESFIANEAEKRFSRLEKKSCTPAGCEKNNPTRGSGGMPHQKKIKQKSSEMDRNASETVNNDANF